MIKKLKELFSKLIKRGNSKITEITIGEMSESIRLESESIYQIFNDLKEFYTIYNPLEQTAVKYFVLSNRQRARDIYNYSKATNSTITNKENEKVTSANCYKYGKGSVATVKYQFTDAKNFKIVEIKILPKREI